MMCLPLPISKCSRRHTPAPSVLASEALMHMAYYALRSGANSFILELTSHLNYMHNCSVEEICGFPFSETVFMLPVWSFSVSMVNILSPAPLMKFLILFRLNFGVNQFMIYSRTLLLPVLLIMPGRSRHRFSFSRLFYCILKRWNRC